MEPVQAMFNEVNITRTLAVDALAGRCVQLAGEKAQLENQVFESAGIIEGLKKEIATLKKETG